jgi:hypothetical protein
MMCLNPDDTFNHVVRQTDAFHRRHHWISKDLLESPIEQRDSPLLRRLCPGAIDDNTRQICAGVALNELRNTFQLEPNAAM